MDKRSLAPGAHRCQNTGVFEEHPEGGQCSGNWEASGLGMDSQASHEPGDITAPFFRCGSSRSRALGKTRPPGALIGLVRGPSCHAPETRVSPRSAARPAGGASGPDSSEGTPRQEGRETDAGHVAAPPCLHQLSFFLQELLRTSLVVQRLRL